MFQMCRSEKKDSQNEVLLNTLSSYASVDNLSSHIVRRILLPLISMRMAANNVKRISNDHGYKKILALNKIYGK